MWRSFDRAAEQRDWTELECTILQSEIAERKIGADVKREYSFGVLYGYAVEGKSQTSDRFSLRGSPWSSSKARAEMRKEKYPLGEETVCYVDPSDPSSAVLKRDSKAPGYSLWFPLIFVVGGLGIVVGSIRGWIRSRAADRAAS